MTVDIGKALDSLSPPFLLACLKKIGFSQGFKKWVKILLESHGSCIINAGTTTSYFNLEKGASQGDPGSAYLFILCLKVLILFVKANHKIRGVYIFQYAYLYTAYAHDNTFFLKNRNSIRQLMENFSTLSQYFCLKPNYEKREIARIRVLKSVMVAVCGMKCVDLCKDTIRITVVHFWHNRTKQDEKKFLETISKIQTVLKIWRMQSLTLEGKIIVFKTLAISKIVYLSMMIKVPTEIIVEFKNTKVIHLTN